MDTDIISIEEPAPRPWGFWATIGFTVAIVIAEVLIQIVAVVGFLVVATVAHHTVDAHSLGSNGLLLAIVTVVSIPVALGLVVLFVRLRKGMTLKDYLCFRHPRSSRYSTWCLILLAFVLLSDSLSVVLGKPIVPPFMSDAYATAGFMPLLWFTLIVVAPVGEEILFRGFLFKGLEASRVGGAGAVIVSSLGWAAMHIQYDWYGLLSVGAMGLLVGIARLRSQSILLPIFLHAVSNLIATVEAAVFVGMVVR